MSKRKEVIDLGDGPKTIVIDDAESSLVHSVRKDLCRLHPKWSKPRLEEEVRAFAARQQKKEPKPRPGVPNDLEPPKRRKSRGYYSRSARAADTALAWRGIAERLRELDVEGESPELPLTVEQVANVVVAAQTILEDFDSGELEALTEEMRSWADNMEEHFGGTEKYERVSEAADTLESIDADAPSVEDADDIEEAADELDGRADEIEGVEFPGMYG